MQTDAIKADKDQSEQEAIDLMTERRWGILPVLAWIATHDIKLATHAASPGRTMSYESAHLSMVRARSKLDGKIINWPHRNLNEAWNQLAEKMAEGKINCVADNEYQSIMGGAFPTVFGLVFPPKESPDAAQKHVVDDDNGVPVLVPKGKVFLQSWTACRNPQFIRTKVLALWPVEQTVAAKRLLDEDTASQWLRDHMFKNKKPELRTTEPQELELIREAFPGLDMSRTRYRKIRAKVVKASNMLSWISTGPTPGKSRKAK